MGCGGSKQQDVEPQELEIVAYRVPRTEHSKYGQTIVRRSDVDRYRASAPDTAGAGKKRYPKKYQNKGPVIHNPNSIQLLEYPTMDYPYNQNASGAAFHTSPGGTRRQIDHGYIRTISDSQKTIHGVFYHPHGNPTRHERAEEIRGRRERR